MHIDTAIVCAAIGIVVAVLSQILVARMPTHQSLQSTPFHCGNCGTNAQPGQWLSLVAQLRGKRHCVNCQNKLWPKFPGLELFCALALALVGLRIGWTITLPAYLVFFTTLVLITVIDLRHYMIPTRLIYPALLLTFLLLALASAVRGNFTHLGEALIGMAALWLVFFVLWFIYPAGMGFGDVRLSALIGLVSGYAGPGNVVLSGFLAFLIGAVVGVGFILVSLKNRKRPIPFGPFLAAGATVSLLFGTLFASS